jgi:Flp pilus assembly protein TadG
MLTAATPQGFMVHWSESRLANTSSDASRMVAMAEILPYQDRDFFPSEDEAATEILNSSEMAESTTNGFTPHARKVFMVWGPSPLRAPTPL